MILTKGKRMNETAKVMESASTSAGIKNKFLPWIIWSCGGFFYFYQFIIRASPSSMTEELMDTFQVHGLALGVLVAFYSYAYSPMQIPLGVIMDRFGPRKILIFSCSLCILGCLIFASASSLPVACASRFLMGVGSACAWIGSIKLATLWFPPHRVGTVIGATMFLGTAGPSWAIPILAKAVDSFGWRQSMYGLGTIGIFLVIFMWFVVRDHPPTEDSLIVKNQKQEPILSSLKKILLSKNVIINAFFAMLMYVPLAAFADLWGVTFIQDLYQISKPLAASIVSATFFGMGIGALVVSHFSDRIGSRRLPMIISAAGSLIVYALIFYVPGVPLKLMYCLTFLSGFFFTGQLMCFASAVEMVPVSSSGAVVGFTNMTVMLSGVIFQPCVGWLLDLSHKNTNQYVKIVSDFKESYNMQDWRFALSSITVCLVIALFLTIFIKETHPKTRVIHTHA